MEIVSRRLPIAIRPELIKHSLHIIMFGAQAVRKGQPMGRQRKETDKDFLLDY